MMAKHESETQSSMLSTRRHVKSGCQTCKRRKVKCDENWPACHRCQSTGRACDGYGIWGGGSHACQPRSNRTCHVVPTKPTPPLDKTKITSLMQPIPLFDLQAEEKNCFEWFMHRSARKLPGLFVCQQWTALLFQASLAEPAVRHAMLALSSAHKEEVRGFGVCGRRYEDDQTIFTVQQYNKAVRNLRTVFVDSKAVSMRITLMSCALFVSTEFLRANYTNGLLHLHYGINLLQENQACIGYKNPEATYVDGWLITIFTRLTVQAKLLGQLSDVPCRNVVGQEFLINVDAFRSIHHARRSLEHLILRALDIQEQSRTSNTTHKHSVALLEDQSRVEIELDIWFQTCEMTIRRLPDTANVIEGFTYRFLRLYYYQAIIIAGTCLDTADEARYDQYQAVFLKIVLHCIQIHHFVYPDGKRNPKGHHDPEPTSPNSISDMGWIAPLYFTAINCRNHRLRHQAIELMQTGCHKEGIWNSDLVTFIARKVVETEEGDFYAVHGMQDKFRTLDPPTEKDLATASLPACFRMSNLEITLPDDKSGRLSLKYCQPQTGGSLEWKQEELDLQTRQWSCRTYVA